ncbi:LacI family DNA-binding transcriptional regulator [Saccharospirillum alexandrii]|uniref:LacI family DNA-binding transcriptional regulator n=1 Tax=Saccharospirillum alexandrii TaxID=2448477 RepID=UPI000FDA54C1|nr:LacI family DNA-binding transcriptional regulator [Saccharospirillum alexandrii]
MSKKRVTLADVARLAGLSTSAASMILTGRPDTRLSPEAHAKVHEAAATLGYRPNMAARALRTDKTRTLAFISDHIATTRYGNGLIRGALAASEEAGHVLMMLETYGDPAHETRAIDAAIDRQVDGIIFAFVRSREVFLPSITSNVRMVMLNGTNRQCPIAILPDEYQGGCEAVSLLADANFTDGIVLLGHNAEVEEGLFRSGTILSRLNGIRSEMVSRGLGFVDELSSWNWEPENGYKLMKKYLKNSRPKALLCMNDRLAFGAYQALSEAGLKIPEDVSVVSFDNDEIAAYLRPGLTTIGLPHEAMGREAVRVLLDEKIVESETLVAMEPMIRGSVGGAD